MLRNLAHYAEQDVRGQLETYDEDGNGLIEYDAGHMTGNDADAVSFHWRDGNLDRTESAYVYSNALAAANAYDALGEEERAAGMRDVADTVRTAVLDHLWDPEDRLLKHRHVESGELVPWKEINNYYPFSVGLMPTPEEDPQYLQALRLWADAEEYPVFPFYTANQADKAEAAEQGFPGSNNFSVINSTVTFRFLASVLRHYPSEYIDNEYYAKLLSWNAWAHYIDGDNNWPDQNEFWADGSADPQDIGYRSWIHHTILGTTNWTVIEDAMGFQPRADDKIELWPIDIDWPHFAVSDINYHGTDLAVVWDEPGDGERPYGQDVPEGYSVYLDGRHAFTVDDLAHLVYDPATGGITFPEGGAEVVASQRADLPAAHDITYGEDDRLTEVFAQAGRDITLGEERENLAAGAVASASYEAEGRDVSAAVDGFTINEPYWGTDGSGNAQDWLRLDFGRPVSVDSVNLYFASDKQRGGYAEPASYTVQYLDGSRWRDVGSAVRSPAMPRANHNEVRFEEVTTTAVRAVLRHQPGTAGGLKEIQVFDTGRGGGESPNLAPQVIAWQEHSPVTGQYQLAGVVKDDGNPQGRLDIRWETVSAPEGGAVFFDEETAPTTTVRFTEAGTYVLRLTADDGSERSSREVTVESGDIGRVNIAATATPTASHTSAWESVEAINDGAEPESSAGSPRWGTWPEKGTQWVEYTWDEPVRVEGSDMYFFRDAAAGDADGVGVPASWSIQWRDGGTWRDLADPSEYGVAEDTYNSTAFTPVTTTVLRATLNGQPNLAVGIQEWKVYAEPPESVRETHVPTRTGVVPELPAEATLVYADGSTTSTPVDWSAVSEDDLSEGGTGVRVPGLTRSPPMAVEATIWVRLTDAVHITALVAETVRTDPGVAPVLPEHVVAVYNDGSRDSATAVDWAEISPDQYARPGSFTVAGVVEGTEVRASAVVRVGDRE
ncbi:galactose-binding domain-containing protein [Streptomyces johnsoniae]|uniref:Ig-like domain-containing protein n=1 Tax=Streptomyces johnsoniae TaxID=3075532 RepID=A0ABU2SC64_9ACTN|nr:Ig-like domain-containing protein [Streptomyces sp. DSM 41886]MDT0446571.1 Ig-like domain-containing protein [Streptomyces sp. DSM 41886]